MTFYMGDIEFTFDDLMHPIEQDDEVVNPEPKKKKKKKAKVTTEGGAEVTNCEVEN